MRVLLSLVVTLLLAACAQQAPVKLYAGAEKSDAHLLVVEMPNTLEILDINGQPAPVANRMTGNSDRRLHLEPGEYRINAFYQNVFDVDGGLSTEVIRTRSATFMIDGKAGDVWRIEADQPGSLSQARQMQKSFSGWAVNTLTGERVASSKGPAHVSVLGQLMGGVAIADPQSGIAPLDAQPATSNAAPAASQMAAQTLPHNDATFTTLQQIWLLLGSDSRKAFLEWAAGQGQ